MNEEKELSAPGCSRREELIAIVYGEATNPETQRFQRHMHSCAECTEDYAAFKGIRNSVFSWRQETLGFITQPERTRRPTERSALAAIREFLSLSPLWLRGAVALASVVFCLLAVSVISRSRPDTNSALTSSTTDAEIEKLVEARTKERLATLKAKEESSPIIASGNNEAVKPPQSGGKPAAITSKQVAINPERKPLTKAERDQLAADLRLTAADDESDFDPLGDGYNRQD